MYFLKKFLSAYIIVIFRAYRTQYTAPSISLQKFIEANTIITFYLYLLTPFVNISKGHGVPYSELGQRMI